MTSLRPLFGGAILCYIPDGFIDVSEFREVPNHQEVFAFEEADQSIIVEILEMAPGSNMEEVGIAHWKSLARLNRATATSISDNVFVDPVEMFPNLHLPPNSSPALARILIGGMTASKFNEAATNQINVAVLVLRLPSQNTDILIVLNSPHAINPQSSSAQVADQSHALTPPQTIELFSRIVASISISDWGLFP